MHYTGDAYIQALIRNAKIYSAYADTKVQFFFSKAKNKPISNCQIYFGKRNFMHLVGIDSSTCSSEEFYEKCREGTVDPVDCKPSHSIISRDEKVFVFPKLFEFSNSKIYKMGEKDASTAFDDFYLATGNDAGTIGYDFREVRKDYAIPVTLLPNPISKYCTDLYKIIAVFQINDESDSRELLFEIAKGVAIGL